MTTRPVLRRGDVVLVRFPFTDLSATRLRPALIVGRPAEDVILAFITSHKPAAPPHASCPLTPADAEFGATGLKVASSVRLDKLATLHHSLIRRRLGRIGTDTEARVARALRYVFDL